MDSFKDSVAFWTSILGTLVGVFGTVQSLNWLAVTGVLVASGSVGVLIYARKERLLVKFAMRKVFGRSIDSLNAASLRRRVNQSLVMQEAENLATIDGEDLTFTWKCVGYCEANMETAIEFSIDADANTPFDDLDCFAYDLRRDPKRQHRIRPILLGPDGISKKIAVPFLAPLRSQEPFSMILQCRLPGCMKTGVDYYTATLSFNQERIERYSMRLVFPHDAPKWVRTYECRPNGDVKLLNDLRPLRKSGGSCEYLDVDHRIAANSARIYMFFREALKARGGRQADAEAA
jgi:hypothetical protein